ncbi:MAG: ATP-binding cassette domain-containing protein [Propionibacteriaceae bacterium]|nr:ATP-binding cassette domain-containing protein [Propionibacteriaceae bacterium]
MTKSFSGKLAVDDVSISMKEGDIYGFIGENGAGKTTLMRMVCGLASPTSGLIELFGSRNLVAQRHKVGCTIENPALYPAMTAMENMEVQRLTLGIKDHSVCASLLDLAGISYTGQKKARDFSLGMKQRLMIALALLGDPQLMVLDEPTNGLDPVGIKEVRDTIQKLNHERGISVLISSHILGELEKLATRYGVISHGKLVDEFQSDEIAGRVGRNIVIDADDATTTQQIIGRMFPGVRMEQTPDHGIRVFGHVDDAGAINKQLVMAGITVNALVPQGENLESYFLKLMAGGHNA